MVDGGGYHWQGVVTTTFAGFLVASAVGRRRSTSSNIAIFSSSVAICASASQITARAVSHTLLDFCDILLDRIPDSFSSRKCLLCNWLPADVGRVAFCLLAVAIEEKPTVTRLDVVELAASPRVAWLVKFSRSAILVLVDHLLSVSIRRDAEITGKDGGQNHEGG